MNLKINEIFYSIQGESSYAGRPCVFIRLSGCNLRCVYCDTKYAYDEGYYTGITEIVEKVKDYECTLVEITGGEPLLQENTPFLIRALSEKGFEVLLETNGTLDISQAGMQCIKIMDIKCPSSGESHRNRLENLSLLGEKDEIKFVVADRQDYEFARNIISTLPFKPFKPNPVHISPVFGKIKPEQLSEWMIKDRLNARLQIQLHKIIWNPDKRGV